MNNLAFLVPIAAITIGPLTWAFTTWVRARHGYPIEDRSTRRYRHMMPWNPLMRGLGDLNGSNDDGSKQMEASRKIELLSSENERLTGQISRLEERLRVLERIVTDPAERTAREIDALR